MAESPENKDDGEPFPSELERVKFENFLLQQRRSFEKQFQKHNENIDSQINRGHLKLSVIGIIVLIVAWVAVVDRVQERIDEQFDTKKIQDLIYRAATDAAKKVIEEQVAKEENVETKKLKCLIDKYGLELFLLQCRSDGGEPQEMRGLCNYNGKEIYYARQFPEIACG